jgi:hypothetical protein
MEVGKNIGRRKQVKRTRQTQRAYSEFLDPILELKEGVSILRPYSVALLLKTTVNHVVYLCKEGSLPHIRIGETYFIFVDHRPDNSGEYGGKFTRESSPNFPELPHWQGRLICHLRK